jgi:hypothetical protein
VNRRGFLGLLFGAVVAPIKKLLPVALVPAKVAKPAITLAMLNEAYQIVARGESTSDLIMCHPVTYANIINSMKPVQRFLAQPQFQGASIVPARHIPKEEIQFIHTKEPSMNILMLRM